MNSLFFILQQKHNDRIIIPYIKYNIAYTRFVYTQISTAANGNECDDNNTGDNNVCCSLYTRFSCSQFSSQWNTNTQSSHIRANYNSISIVCTWRFFILHLESCDCYQRSVVFQFFSACGAVTAQTITNNVYESKIKTFENSIASRSLPK